MFEDRYTEKITWISAENGTSTEICGMVLQPGFSRTSPEEPLRAEHIFLVRSPAAPSPGDTLLWQNRQWHLLAVRELCRTDGTLECYRCLV